MVRRQLAQRQVTDVAMPQTGDIYGEMAGMAMNYADIKKKQDVIKMNDYLADANMEMMKTTQDWRVANSEDPFDQDQMRGLDKSYDAIFGKYDSKIGMASRKDWYTTKQKAKAQYNESTTRWGIKQVRDNVVSTYNKSIDKSNAIAQEYGKNGDLLGAKKYFINQKALLNHSATNVLTQNEIEDTNDNWKSDYTKNFVLGAIATNPEEGKALLDMPAIRKDIGSSEAVNTLNKFADTERKRVNKDVIDAQRATAIIRSSSLINDINSMSIADIQEDLAGGLLEPDDAKILLNAKVGKVYADTPDNVTYNSINDMISGTSRKEDGKEYRDDEISMEIVKNAQKLTNEEAKELSESIPQKRKNMNHEVEGVAANNIRSYLDKINNGDINVDESIRRFHQQVFKSKANPEKIKTLADEWMVSETMKVDPTFSRFKKEFIENQRNISRVKVGTIITNFITGEQNILNKEGRWVTVQ